MFRFSEAEIEAGDITGRGILATAEQRIPEEFADQPQLRDELLAGIRRARVSEAQKTPYAMVLDVGGTINLHSVSGLKRQPVPQTLLYSGDRLSLGADGQVQLVILSDLHKERLRPGTEATIRRKGCEPAAAISEPSDDPLMTFVRLPKGTFYMGWDGQKKGVKTEIKDDFELARPEGAFYAFPRAHWGTGSEFVAEAIKNNLLIIPGNVFSTRDSHFRISYAVDDATLRRGLDTLQRLARSRPA